MKKFEFKLEKLRKVRKLKEQQALKSLADQNRKVEESQRVLDENRSNQEDIKQTQEKNRTGTVDIHAWRNYNLFLQRMRKDEIESLQDIAENQEILEKKRVVVNRRTSERKIIDKIEEIQLDRYSKEQQKHEQKEFDDIASQRYFRNK